MIRRLALPVLLAVLAAPVQAVDRPEQESLGVLSAIVAGNLPAARAEAERLSRSHPDFRPAGTVAADLRAIELGVDPVALELPAAGEFGVEDWRHEARVRWLHHLGGGRARGDAVPAALLRLPADTTTAIVAETSTSRLYLFANDGGVPRLVTDYYMGIGRAGYLKTAEGDLRTPLGVYRVTRWIDDDELPELYGAGAFPVDYPNGWDRALGRTGHGIWIHGVPRDEYSRPPLSSEGCMTVSNAQIEELRGWIEVGSTPVVAVERIRWLDEARWQGLREELTAEVERWRRAWETDAGGFRARYATDFVNRQHGDLASWLSSRRQFEPGERSVRVELRDLALLRYGGEEEELWQASFVQRFVSDDLDSEVRKEQLWRRGREGWEIVYEDIIGL